MGLPKNTESIGSGLELSGLELLDPRGLGIRLELSDFVFQDLTP